MGGRARQVVQGLPGNQRLFGDLIVDLVDRLTNRTISSAGFAANGALVRAVSGVHALMSDGRTGRIVAKAANTDMPALAGTVVNATHNVFVFYMDNAGNLTSVMGIAGSSLSAVTFPDIPAGRACLGYVYINPTGTGNFVGGTTTLGDVTVVPNAVYVNVVGPFDPTLIP